MFDIFTSQSTTFWPGYISSFCNEHKKYFHMSKTCKNHPRTPSHHRFSLKLGSNTKIEKNAMFKCFFWGGSRINFPWSSQIKDSKRPKIWKWHISHTFSHFLLLGTTSLGYAVSDILFYHLFLTYLGWKILPQLGF